MSRSGYCDEVEDQWQLIRWRGAVNSAIRGARGQRLLRDLIAALDAMPVKELIAHELATPSGQVCALGAVAKFRAIDVSALDPEDYESVAKTFGIADALTREIVYMNDEYFPYHQTPAERYKQMRAWAVEHLNKDSSNV